MTILGVSLHCQFIFYFNYLFYLQLYTTNKMLRKTKYIKGDIDTDLLKIASDKLAYSNEIGDDDSVKYYTKIIHILIKGMKLIHEVD
jgi:hypothetical protein